jgi:transposase InsO family protein
LKLVYPIENGIKVIQKDNGLEFLGEFDSYLKKKNIKHVFIYPRCPKINAYIERQNRTLQDEFVYANEDLILTSVDEFNKKLIDYLLWYNCQRPHKKFK